MRILRETLIPDALFASVRYKFCCGLGVFSFLGQERIRGGWEGEQLNFVAFPIKFLDWLLLVFEECVNEGDFFVQDSDLLT